MPSDPSFRITSDTAPHPSHRAPEVVPRRCTLDGFIEEVSRADGIGLIDVDAFTTLVVQTENSVYQVTILKPHAKEVLVQGGAFFPVRTKACLNGLEFPQMTSRTRTISTNLPGYQRDRHRWRRQRRVGESRAASSPPTRPSTRGRTAR